MPFLIRGTTADPKFIPDVGGLAAGLLKSQLGCAGGLSSSSRKRDSANSCRRHKQPSAGCSKRKNRHSNYRASRRRTALKRMRKTAQSLSRSLSVALILRCVEGSIAALKEFQRLFIPQRHHRIDTHSAARRNAATSTVNSRMSPIIRTSAPPWDRHAWRGGRECSTQPCLHAARGLRRQQR